MDAATGARKAQRAKQPTRRKPAPKGTGPTKPTAFRIRPEALDKLRELAEEIGISQTELFERMVHQTHRRWREMPTKPDPVRDLFDGVDIISSPPHPRPVTDGDAPSGGTVK